MNTIPENVEALVAYINEHNLTREEVERATRLAFSSDNEQWPDFILPEGHTDEVRTRLTKAIHQSADDTSYALWELVNKKVIDRKYFTAKHVYEGLFCFGKPRFGLKSLQNAGRVKFTHPKSASV